MKILLVFFTVHLISAAMGDISVTGYSGRSLLVDSGKHWFCDSTKYMAKITDWRAIINDRKHDKWINAGRFNLFRSDDGNLMIFIRDLNTHDAGRYAIDVHLNWRIYMTLNVIAGSCCARERVMLKSGETSIFSCEYPHKHINDAKILFKERPDSVKSLVNTTATTSNEGRFSVYDDRQKNLFSVRINAVTPDDGGVYLCGVWIYRHPYSYSIINTVHLSITNFPMIIIISVCVIVLLIGGFTLTVCKLRHKRQSDATPLLKIPSDETTSVCFQKHEESLGEAAVDDVHPDFTTAIYYTELY